MATGRFVVGRQKAVDALHRSLMSVPQVAIIPRRSVVKATGGMGKTTIARFFIQQYHRNYHGIWWVAAETLDSVVEALSELADRLGLEGHSRRGLARATLDYLRQTEESWLLIYDNAVDLRTVRDWLPEGVHLIVTSRSSDWQGFEVQDAEKLPTDRPEDAGVELLVKEAGGQDRDGPQAAQALAAALGGLPLALVQAGAWLRDAPRAGYAECQGRIHELLTLAPPADYPDAIDAAVTLSMERVGQGSDAEALLHLLAFLAPDAIEACVISDVPEAPMINARDLALKADIPDRVWELAEDRTALDRAFSELQRRSLIEGRGGTYSIHRLTQAVVRARLGQKAEDWAKTAAAVVAVSFPGDPESFLRWPTSARLMPHVSALAGLGDDVPRTAGMQYLCNQASIYLRQQAEFAGAARYAELALEIKKERLPENHRDLGVGYSVLGQALQDLGDLDRAENALAEAVRIAEANTEISDTDRSVWLNNHGSVLQALGQRAMGAGDAETADEFFQCAEQRFLAALDLDRQTYGDRHPEVATGLNNLATLYAAMGRMEDALDKDAQALSIRRERLDPKDPLLAQSCNNYAAKLLRVGEVDKAAPLLREALEIREHHFGDKPWHPHLLATAQWRASCLVALDDLGAPGGAELERLERVYGPHGLDMAVHLRDGKQFAALARQRQQTDQADQPGD
ncbi:MAG: tetratricopeptide repeat protein [Pseudomonadota bacterium]